MCARVDRKWRNKWERKINNENDDNFKYHTKLSNCEAEHDSLRCLVFIFGVVVCYERNCVQCRELGKRLWENRRNRGIPKS